jgi:hypothetical protein
MIRFQMNPTATSQPSHLPLHFLVTCCFIAILSRHVVQHSRITLLPELISLYYISEGEMCCMVPKGCVVIKVALC